jgi:divalent metal cation (Fe/Co/Zn/Cd) transporter
MVLFEDSAALVGIVIAAIATFLATRGGMPQADGIGSILIGLVLAVTASLLARESKSLLVGEQADRRLNEAIVRLAEAEPDIERVNGVLTAQLAPDQILVALSVEFPDALTTAEIERQVMNLERRLRASHPSIFAVFVKPQTKAMFEEIVRDRYGDASSR